MPCPFSLIAIAAYLAVVARVLAYRRHGARHRHHVSWTAWALLVVAGGSAIELMLDAKAVGPFEAGTAIFIALFVILTRGDVARLLRRD
ncbi:MAG: phage holin family protein [Janthinobacterium lividum]